jgi:hypothetical protein
MGRVLHPKSFPECSPSILIPESLERSMEVYWRVKKWQFNGSFNYGGGNEDTISFIFDVSNPQLGEGATNETDLVCPKQRLTFFYPSDAIDLLFVAFLHGNNTIDFKCDFNSFGTVAGPYASDDRVFASPMTFQMGSYLRTMYAEAGNQANLTSTISLTALEWWEYRDANGENPLYDKDTGEPID